MKVKSALEDSSGNGVTAIGEEGAKHEDLTDAHENDDDSLAEAPPLHAVVKILRKRAT